MTRQETFLMNKFFNNGNGYAKELEAITILNKIAGMKGVDSIAKIDCAAAINTLESLVIKGKLQTGKKIRRDKWGDRYEVKTYIWHKGLI